MKLNERLCTILVIIIALFMTAGTVMAAEAVNAGIGGDVGYFEIDSVPSGGQVFFDGKLMGPAPVTVPVYGTDTPDHTITLILPGYLTWSQQYTTNPPAGQTIPVVARMVPTTGYGSISVTSSPNGALMTVDGGKGQQAPWVYNDIQSGSHLVQAFLSGYQPYSTIVQVDSGQAATVNAVLSPLTVIGTLQAKSSPGGADLYIDGFYSGSTATTVGNLEAGNHVVHLRLAGYEDYTGVVTIQQSKVTTLDVTLTVESQAKDGDIVVQSNPPGASVFLDGTFMGTTEKANPLDLTGVATGSHTLVINLENYNAYSTVIEVTAGKVSRVTAELIPVSQPTQSGIIQIASSPASANVFLDDIYTGITPLTLPSVNAGTHTLVIRLPGYQDYSSSINLGAGQSLQVDAALTPVTSPTGAGMIPLTILIALAGLTIVMAGRKR
jgi:hypothetical protein